MGGSFERIHQAEGRAEKKGVIFEVIPKATQGWALVSPHKDCPKDLLPLASLPQVSSRG